MHIKNQKSLATYGTLHEALHLGGLRIPDPGEGLLDAQRENPQLETDGEREDGVHDDEEGRGFQPGTAVGR